MYGQHVRHLDDKNRIALPNVYKAALGNTFFITKGIDKNYELRSVENFQIYSKNLQEFSQLNSKGRHFNRILMSKVVEVNVDKQGRILIPKFVIDELTIQKEVIFVGTGSIIELWSKEGFEQFENSYSDEDLAQLADYISKVDIHE